MATLETTQRSYFLKTCETGNITKAADELYVTRQTLSASLSRFEEELGVPLFVRSKTGVVLTKQGELVRSTLLEQDRLWEDCLCAIGAMPALKHELRISMIGSAVGEETYAIAYDFETLNPNMAIRVVNLDFHSALEALDHREVDVVMGAYPTPEGVYDREELDLGAPCLIVSSESRLARLNEIDFLKDMVGETILYEGPYAPETFKEDCKRLGIATKPIIASRSVIVQMIAHGDGCLCMPERACGRFLSEKTCVRPFLNLTIRIASAFISRKNSDPQVRAFVQFFVDRMRQPAALPI